jgi:hypothetical protein
MFPNTQIVVTECSMETTEIDARVTPAVTKNKMIQKFRRWKKMKIWVMLLDWVLRRQLVMALEVAKIN